MQLARERGVEENIILIGSEILDNLTLAAHRTRRVLPLMRIWQEERNSGSPKRFSPPWHLSHLSQPPAPYWWTRSNQWGEKQAPEHGRDGDRWQAGDGALHHDPQVDGQHSLQLTKQGTHCPSNLPPFAENNLLMCSIDEKPGLGPSGCIWSN